MFILENVKGLLNHDSGKSAGLIFTLLRESGYAVDEKVCNTKEFGLPQNRERVFIVGLREDLCPTLPDFWHFDFPVPPRTPCKLSDVLGDEVDEKYYLKPAMVKKLLQYNERNKDKGNGFSAVFHSPEDKMSALKVGEGGTCDLVSIKKIGQTSSDGSQAGQVYDTKGLFPAMCAGTHGYAMGNILQLNNPTHSNDRVYSDKGLSPTLNTMQGGNRQPKIAIPVLTPDRTEKKQNGCRFKDDGDPSFTLTAQDRHGVMIIDDTNTGFGGIKTYTDNCPTLRAQRYGLKVAEATTQGYAIADEGDSINLSVPNSKARRGRVGKGVAQTLDTGMQQYTLKNARIRRLTPKECARLQGLEDDWLDFGINEKGETYRLSDSAKYRLAGNGVSVPVVSSIIHNIL